MVDTFVDWKKMRPLTRKHFKLLKVGDRVYYVNDADELNTITYDKKFKAHNNRVVYEAIIKQISSYNIVLECTPLIGSIHGWQTCGHVESHTESFSYRSEGCKMSKQWLYSTVEWELVD